MLEQHFKIRLSLNVLFSCKTRININNLMLVKIKTLLFNMMSTLVYESSGYEKENTFYSLDYLKSALGVTLFSTGSFGQMRVGRLRVCKITFSASR